MTKDNIVLMADASGISYYGMGKDGDKFLHYLEAFANLVAEHEREACAVIAETPISGEQDDITMQAKDRVAAAIRARGQA